MNHLSLFKYLLVFAVLCSVGYCRPPNDDGAAGLADADYVADDNQDAEEEDLDDAEEDDNKPRLMPNITNAGQVISVNEGDDVTLACDTVNADDFVRVWRNRSSIVYQETNALTADKSRVFLNPRYGLQILNVTKYDSGVYTCTVMMATAGPAVHHTLHVKEPARIDVFEPVGINGTKIIEKGKSLSLICHASGYPKPTVFWTRRMKGSSSPEPLAGTNHTITSVTREHSGIYECVAKNQDKTDKKTVEIFVQYAPEVSIKSDTVNTAEGKVSEMHCLVHAQPAASLMWLKGDRELKSDDHLSLYQDPNKAHKHILKIEKTKSDDFGTYYCVATNALGTTRKAIVLSGTPLRPIFEGASIAGDNKSPRLVWTVESLSDIKSYELQYRKQEADGDTWIVVHPKVLSSGDAVHYAVVHDLHGLEPGTYEAVLRAENAYGWSYPSPPNIFSGEDNMNNEILQGPLEPNPNHASQLRISFALVLSIVIAMVYC